MNRRTLTVVGALGWLFLHAACDDGKDLDEGGPVAPSGNAAGVASISDALSVSGADGELGSRLFFDEFPDVQGNGRTCNTCHVAEDGFQLTPAHAEARWQALQQRRRHHLKANPNANVDDPLFRSIDADDFARDFTTLRNHGLVRVNIQMAPNVRALDDPSARSVAVWRSTPTVFNVAITAPYQLDGRFPTLQQQALGALLGHAEIKQPPASRLLDGVAAFEKLIFPDRHSFEVARAVQDGAPVPQEPAPCGPSAIQGKAIFVRECAFCHSGPAFNQQQIPGLFLGDIFVSKPLPPFADPTRFLPSPPLPIRMWAITLPDGSEVVRPSTDPGKALITGNPEDFNNFEITQLRGIRKTAPYFHDNSAATLSEVARHYQSFFAALRVAGVPGIGALADDEIEPLVAYLSTL